MDSRGRSDAWRRANERMHLPFWTATPPSAPAPARSNLARLPPIASVLSENNDHGSQTHEEGHRVRSRPSSRLQHCLSHQTRSLADGQPSIPTRCESRQHTASETASTVSQWLHSSVHEREGIRPSTSNTGKHIALASAVQDMTLAPCCRQTKSHV